MSTTVSKSEYTVVKKVIKSLFSNEQWDNKKNKLTITKYDWLKLLKYCVWIAVFCFCLAIISFITGPLFLQIIESLGFKGNGVILVCIGLASYGCGIVVLRKPQNERKKYVVELFMGLGSTFVFCGGFVFNEMKATPSGSLACSLFFGLVGYTVDSSIVWLMSLLFLGGHVGLSAWYSFNTYYLFISQPKMICWTGSLLMIVQKFMPRKTLSNITKTVGCLYFFVSYWGISVWDEYYTLFTLLYFASCVVTCLVGFLVNDIYFRRFGMVFLVIELFTKYFQHFWDITHKTVFFLILGLMFLVIGFKGKDFVRFVDGYKFVKKRD